MMTLSSSSILTTRAFAPPMTQVTLILLGQTPAANTLSDMRLRQTTPHSVLEKLVQEYTNFERKIK